MLQNCFVDIMNCALTGNVPAAETISSVSLHRFYAFASLNKLIPLTVKLLPYWTPADAEEEALIAQWKSEAMSLVFLEYKKISLLKELLRLAEEKNTPLIFFKGYLLAGLYPDFTLRNSSDTDILVDSAHLAKMQLLLTELHYYPASELDTENVYTYIYEEAGFAVHKIELHTSLFEDAKGSEITYLNELSLTSPDSNIQIDCCGVRLTTMSPHKHLIYQIFHMVKHLGCHGFPARYLLDTALFIHANYEQIDWPAFHETMQTLGYHVFVDCLFTILAQHFHVPEAVLRTSQTSDAPISVQIQHNNLTDLLLTDILQFGARSWNEQLSDAFYYFETHLEKLEQRDGQLLDRIAYDGTTVPTKKVPTEYQHHPLLQKRIQMLRELRLI